MMSRRNLANKNKVVLLSFLAVILSIIVIIIMYNIKIIYSISDIVLLSIGFTSIWTTLFVLYLTGIASKYTILSATALVISLLGWYILPYLTSIFVMFLLPIYIVFAIGIIPAIILIYIWVKLYNIFR